MIEPLTGDAPVPTSNVDRVAALSVSGVSVGDSDVTPAGRGQIRRGLLLSLTFLAACLAYTDRVNMSVASVVMQERFGWSQTQKGFVLSSFSIGYMLCLLLGGWLATRFGGKRLLGLSVIVWSLCTLLTPMASAVSMAALLATRIAMGAGESFVFPSAFEIIGRWVPAAQRTRATAWVLSGIPVGQVAGLLITGWLLAHFEWPAAFYSFGVVGLLWAAVWFLTMTGGDTPASQIPAKQLGLQQAGESPGRTEGGPVPWRRLLLSVPVIALLLGHFASNWILYVLLAWLPSYFRDVLHMTVSSAGMLSAGPWLTALVVMNIAGPISDALIARGISVTTTRKLMQCSGLIISAVFLLAMRDIHSPAMALVLLCTATGALGLTWCGYAPGLIDVAPRHSAIVGSFTNTISTIPGIVGITVTGWLLDVTGTYSAAFILTAAISVLSAIVFGLFFSARPVIE